MKKEKTIRRRGGFAIWYSVVMLSALCLFVSLATDYGRMQVTKAQLRRTADAAARYGASGLRTDAATAVSRAKVSVAENVDDTTVSTTVKTGHWDTSALKFIENGTPLDAVQVSTSQKVPLLFGKLLNGQTNCAVLASAVCVNNALMPNFVGIKSISAKNNASLGYRSSSGAPGAVNQNNSLLMGSNGTISFNNNLSINGAIVLGPSGTFTGSSPTPIQSATALSYPSTEAPPFPSSGDLVVSGTMHLSGGTLVYTNINFGNNSSLIFDAPTTLYVTGSINAAQGSNIQPASDVPADLMIRMSGGPGSVFGGNNANNLVVTAQVYAPDSDFTSKNNADLYGSVLFRSIDVKNNLNAYYDTDSGSVLKGLTVLSNSVTTVQ